MGEFAMPDVKAGDYWIVGFSGGDGGVSYTVAEILETGGGKLVAFVPGNEVDQFLDSIDVWVRKVEMP